MADVLIEYFVDGKVQRRFTEIEDALLKFIAQVSPILEEVNLRLHGINEEKYEKITGKKIEDSVRKDLAGAKMSLASYNRMFGMIDHRLAMAGSNFQFRDFAAEQGVPNDLFVEAQQELQEYWGVTYGPLVDHYAKVCNDLATLRGYLEKQIEILQQIPTRTYKEGFDLKDELRVLFAAEYKFFYDRIVPLSRMNYEHESALEKTISNHFARLKTMIKVYYKFAKTSVAKDFGDQPSKIRKALIVGIYMLGAYLIVTGLKRKTLSGFTQFLKDKFISKKLTKTHTRVNAINEALNKFADDKFEDVLIKLVPILS